MDNISWLVLNESARASLKSFSSDSLKAIPNGSVFALPVSSASYPSLKQASNNQNLNSTQNSPSSGDKNVKRRAVIRGGSSISGVSNVGLIMPSSLPVFRLKNCSLYLLRDISSSAIFFSQLPMLLLTDRKVQRLPDPNGKLSLT